MRSQPVRLVAGAAVTNFRRGQSQLSNMGALSANAARRSKPVQPFGNRRRAAMVTKNRAFSRRGLAESSR
jgi:hypothetical protein